ncbi:MAG: serine/threonine protein kinase [Candidatus Brocadiae bacterium]|nr:serine/threonine protein kinase [Candidatus Brocadiia bacterium]
MIAIPLNRCSSYRKKCKILFLFLVSFFFFFLSLMYDIPPGSFWEKASVFLNEELERTMVLGLLCFSFFWVLLRKRYCLVDKSKGIFLYSLPLAGKSSYYMVEVQSILLEVDMSYAMVRLKNDKLYRVYLKLHNGKNLLIAEESLEKKATEVSDFLKEIFCVEIEYMQRMGWKTGVEINLGSYTIQKELSHGGMGKVFLALDRNGQRVAIKILPSSMSFQEKSVESFFREIKILQKLCHPGIVRFLDFGQDKGQYGDVYFYAMEFLEGKPLASFISEKNLSIQQSVHIAMQVALALEYSHSHRIVHRDIKPSNIMLKSNYQAVLIDFGIARDTGHNRPTHKGYPGDSEVSHYVGTLPYMSPEQLSSSVSIDYRTDIYSLGITLYEMLTCEKPFQGGEQSVYRSILSSYPYEPSSINLNIPADLDTIVMKSIEKNKYQRYQSSAEMAEDLSRFLKGEPILSKPVSSITKIWRRIRSIFKWI